MRLMTLNSRGTDVVVAALKLSERFTRDDLIEEYGKLRRSREGALPEHWKQGISNELQRLSSDFSRYHKERRELDLFAHRTAGVYSIRDQVRPRLLEAANERADLVCVTNTLIISREDAGGYAPNRYNHLVGVWAHQMLMGAIRRRGCEILRDTSLSHAYDFTFRHPGRRSLEQIMECKGTQHAELNDVLLLPNEMSVIVEGYQNYWLGTVANIEVKDGTASGGVLCITPPPVLDRWRFVPGSRLRRIETPIPQLPF